MSPETVAARPRGLELWTPPGRGVPLSGLGEKRSRLLAKLGIETVQDLLQHYPRYHVDRTRLSTIAELARQAGEGQGKEVQVHAKVLSLSRPVKTRPRPGTKARKVMIRGRIGDETGTIEVTWFNQEWVARALPVGTEAFFYGRLGTFRGKLQMLAPRFEPVRTGKEPFNVGRIIPIYPATAELTSDQIRRAIWDVLKTHGRVADPIPDEISGGLGLMTRAEALRLIHFPDAVEDVLKARERLVFDEVFTLQLGLLYRKRKLERTVQGIAHPPPGADSLAESFVAALPFELTRAQRRACAEVASDMARPSPMHRLLEGEVGSGKTVVALYAFLIAIAGGAQGAFMAPTEVLAEQHYLTLNELLDRAFGSAEARNLFTAVSRRPVVRILTGSTAAAQREAILKEVASGDVDLLVGTHALIQSTVDFKHLGLAVVDEQHRFGVEQRRRLRGKGVAVPDVLVMTATPIPRTLAVTIYGDLDLSILDELPKGRLPVTTRIVQGDSGRKDAYELIRSQVSQGRQAFIVYALRDESSKIEVRNAKAEAKRLAAEIFPELEIGLVHGDMKSDQKERAMTEFRDGVSQVLVATTVIEVGVDVPNATVMLIDNAERFGLAQLHQLRGRIGRGSHASHCLLATDVDLSRAADDPSVTPVAERLQALVRSQDGFELAETDLRQRGEGQLFGTRQSGMPQLKITRVLQHQNIIKKGRELAAQLLDGDPELTEYDHEPLAREMRARFPENALEVVHSG
ncbi:MAG: ATP-dependent DNA helicase RecG [Actinomycetota bacterium]